MPISFIESRQVGLVAIPQISQRRARELAHQVQLSLADVIELTGMAPDHDGHIGVLGVDESGFRFTLSEVSLRQLSADEQLRGRRLMEQGNLSLPCTPAELVAFDEKWGEFGLPNTFTEEVREVQAGIALDRFRDQLLEGLAVEDLRTAVIDFALFLELTDFDENDKSHTTAGGGYQYRHDECGRVVAVEAGSTLQTDDYWEDVRATAAFQRAAHLAFPTTAEQLVQWLRNQSGAVQLTIPGDEQWPAQPHLWIQFVKDRVGSPVSVSDTSPPKRRPTRTNEARHWVGEVMRRLEGQRVSDLVVEVRKGLIADAQRAAANGDRCPFYVEDGVLKKVGQHGEYEREPLRRVIKGLQDLSDSSR